ncbi:MAG: DNA/RNA non-specific endonuclease [Candidatus Zixiibacteriota bacterium]
MKNAILTSILLGLLLLAGCSSRQYMLYEPHGRSGGQFVRHSAYTVSYNENYELANWVAYELTREELNGKFERTNDFRPDPMIFDSTADVDDYYNSGYDRGHLAPAADMAFSSIAMSESFFFSNIAPQEASFNRGIWKKLESQVRDWAEEYGEVQIVTGPAYIDVNPPRIGDNEVAVPDYFFKTVLVWNTDVKKAIGFLMPNKRCEKDLSDYAVSVDSVETFTGFDFYHVLPDDIEETIEREASVYEWSFD